MQSSRLQVKHSLQNLIERDRTKLIRRVELAQCRSEALGAELAADQCLGDGCYAASGHKVAIELQRLDLSACISA